jgi:hypothetical protein
MDAQRPSPRLPGSVPLDAHERAAVARRVLQLERRLKILDSSAPVSASARQKLRDELSAMKRILRSSKRTGGDQKLGA